MSVKREPDFLIIGAQRCGTTSLYYYLLQHPKVNPAARKEIHFFDNHYNLGLEWYEKQFSFSENLTGEATPYYILHPHAPTRICKYYPDIKLIILLRNPIDRALSHYNHEKNLGVENLDFEEAIEQEPNRLKGELDKMLQNDNYYSYNYQHFSYLERGKYVKQLERWFSLFSRDQFFIISSEDFYTNPSKIANAVFGFLNISSKKLDDVNNKMKLEYKPMKYHTRQKLTEYFKTHNERLYSLLNRNFNWS